MHLRARAYHGIWASTPDERFNRAQDKSVENARQMRFRPLSNGMMAAASKTSSEVDVSILIHGNHVEFEIP